MSAGNRPIGDKDKILAVLAFLASIALLVFHAEILAALGNWLAAGSDEVCSADFAYVLPGEEETRPFAAAVLYRSGLVSGVVVPQVETEQNGLAYSLSSTQIIHDVLLSRGVPPDSIHIVPGSTTSTMDDIKLLAQFLHKRPHATVLIVTSLYHVRRTRYCVRRIFGRRTSQIHIVAVPSEWYSTDDWWARELPARLVTSEYCKLIYYWWRWSPPASKICAALLLVGLFLAYLAIRANVVRAPDGDKKQSDARI